MLLKSQFRSGSFVANLVLTALTVIITVASLIYTTQITGPLPISITQTSTEKQSTFNVMGESELITVPDQAQINVGVTQTRSTVAAAQDATNASANAIIESLKQLGIDKQDIKTTNYSVNPQYDYNSGRSTITGYNVSSTVRITVRDLDMVNQAIDIATAEGANRVNGISFDISSEKEEELKKEAREEAISNAKDNAKELAGLAGMKLGKIVNIVEHQSASRQPVPMYAMMEADVASSAPTQVEAGSATYTYQVTLSYETL